MIEYKVFNKEDFFEYDKNIAFYLVELYGKEGLYFWYTTDTQEIDCWINFNNFIKSKCSDEKVILNLCGCGNLQ